MSQRRCQICGTGLPVGVLCIEHFMLKTLTRAVANGTVSDWPAPPPPLPLTVTHLQFMTDAHAKSPDWRTQILVELAELNVLWDDD